MIYKIFAPQRPDSVITPPPSKSISNRALIIHALTEGKLTPQNLSDCDDTEVMINALSNKPETIDIMAAGTAMRFLTAYFATTDGEHTITGTERMQQRPIGILVDTLRNLGAEIEYLKEPGYPPLLIRGKKLNGGSYVMRGDVSSQYISAILMIAPYMKNGLELQLSGHVVSRPYIELTLYMMKSFGADADWTGPDTITVKPQKYSDKPCLIENDWSAASYWYEIMALYDHPDYEIKLNGLADGSKQGDSIVKYIFSLLGVKTTFSETNKGLPNTIKISHRIVRVQRFDFDFSNCPDLAQPVIVTCCALNIPFHFTGLSSLKIKETDRIEAMKSELRKVGYVIQSKNDSELMWEGELCEPTFEPIDTYEDHRMAMSFAPLAIKFPGLLINDPEVVSKSYPKFWEDLKQAGFTIEQIAE